MPKRPEPQPLAAIIAELVARAEKGPCPAWEPVAIVPAHRRYRPRYIHPGQLPFRFPEEVPDGTDSRRQ